jgi:hypothetical protein
MANPDAEYIVQRPNPTAMTVTVSRERFKDCASMPPLSYEAKVIDLGRVDTHGDPVTSLALRPTDAPPPKFAAAVGKNQKAALVALTEWARPTRKRSSSRVSTSPAFSQRRASAPNAGLKSSTT